MVRTKVFVGNLSFQIKEDQLSSEFGVAGKVISANIITRGPRSMGYGFVELDSEEDAQNAVKVMNKKDLNGRPINVELAKPQDETKTRQPRAEGANGGFQRRRRRIFHKKQTEEGEVTSNTEREGKREEDEERPRKSRKPHRTGGFTRQKRVSNEEKVESKTTLFVANLPFSLDDDDFAKIVTDLNLKLKSAHVVKKRNGRSKGYGFIEFDSHEDQQKALVVLNKKVVDSRELSVKVALTELKHVQEDEQKETKPVEKKSVPTEKTTEKPAPVEKVVPAEKSTEKPAEKKTAPVEKKTPPAEKNATPTEKKTAPPAEKKTQPAEKSAAPVEKKTAPTEKKTQPAEKKTQPAEKKTQETKPVQESKPAEKVTSPAEKKSATPEKKDEKK